MSQNPIGFDLAADFSSISGMRLIPSNGRPLFGVTPATSSRVGKKSEVTQGTFVTRGLGIRAGHSRIAGTRRPPS